MRNTKTNIQKEQEILKEINSRPTSKELAKKAHEYIYAGLDWDLTVEKVTPIMDEINKNIILRTNLFNLRTGGNRKPFLMKTINDVAKIRTE